MSPFFYEKLITYLDPIKIKKIIDVFKKKFTTCDYPCAR